MSQNTVLLQGRYRVRSILGIGGFSTIYLAVDEATGAEVSIKEFTAEHMDGLATVLRVNAYDIASRSEPQPVPDPSDLSGEEKLSRGLMQVRREAQMLDLFSGVPGVPGCLDTFQENNTFYLVKEYLEGMTCKEYMDRFRGRMPFTLALYIMKGTLEILQSIHSRGYIHCDISPINSFLCRDGGVYLIDWGNAADLSGSMEDHVVRQAVNDLRAFETLEQYIGKKAVVSLIEEDVSPIEFDRYPRDAEYLLKLRHKVNSLIAKYASREAKA